MSIRRRNITARLGRDLQLEEQAHEATRAALREGKERALKVSEERDRLQQQCEELRGQLRALTAELGRQFATDPPATLSRESDLFHLLQEIAPGAIPRLPPTPREFLETVLALSGTSLAEVTHYAGHVADSIT